MNINAIKSGVYPTMITPYTEQGGIDMGAVDALVDWYAENGMDGIFAVCQSSEMFYLTEDERVQLAARVVKKSAGRMCVVASGHISDGQEAQLRELKRMRDTGADAVVLVSNRLAGESESDDVMLKNIDAVINALPDTPLGMYECPYPYKRLLSERVLEEMASSGSFAFIKDTCCDAELIARRVKLLGTRVKLFNANSATLLETLRAGGAGFSGIMANFHPTLYAWLYRNYKQQPEKAELLAAFLSLASGIERGLYPTAAKYHMNKVGQKMTLKCRNQSEADFKPLLKHEIDDLYAVEWHFIAQFSL